MPRSLAILARVGQREIGIALLVVVVWLANMGLPGGVLVPTLDSSWAGALGHALSSRMQFGSEVAFTYGPLGYMFTGHYDPDLFWVRVLVWEIGFGLLVATMMTFVVLRIPGILERSLAFLLLAILPINPFGYELLALTTAGVLLLEPLGRRAPGILALTLVLAALSLVKFPLCVAAGGCVAAVALTRWKEHDRALALGVVAVFLGWFLLVWCLCGQSSASLLPYLRSSVQISSGYEEGMSLVGGTEILLFGLFVFGLIVSFVLVLLVARRPAFRLAAMGVCLLIGAFVAFKSGFVRAKYHTPFFFGWAALAGFLLPTPPELPEWRKTAASLLRVSLAVLGVVGVCGSKYSSPVSAETLVPDAWRQIVANVEGLIDPKGFESLSAESARIRKSQYALPRTCAQVGEDSIDMMSYEQGFLFLNGLAWRPRPVIQGYCALTPELLERNAEFLESDRAPSWVLFRLATIDHRLATMDDGLALQALARDWRPVLQENDLLLYRRSPRDEAADPPRVVLERPAAFGERIELPIAGGTCHVLSLDIRYTLLGRIAKALLRAPPLFLGVETEAGDTYEVRIVPGMMRTGAIIDPWLQWQKSWLDWTTGKPMDRTVAVTVREPSLPWMYSDEIDVRLVRRNGIAPIVDPSLDPEPESAAPPSREGVEGEEMRAPAPSDIHFDLDRGEHEVRGQFGLSPASWQEGGSDGATFSLVVQESNGARRVLYHRRLDPKAVPGDREPQTFEIRFTSRSRARLHLITGPGAKGDSAHDWAWWRSIELGGEVGGALPR